jgi:hypothetical protein
LKGNLRKRNAGESSFAQVHDDGNCGAYRFRKAVSVIEGFSANGEKKGALGPARIELDRQSQERFGAHRVGHAAGEFAGEFNALELNLARRQCGGSIQEKHNVRLADLLSQVGGPLL